MPQPHVTILGHHVPLPTPYVAGSHVLTQAEADALNRAFTTSVAKGLHRVIVACRESSLDAATTTQRIEQFVERHPRAFAQGPERLAAISAEARRIALLALEAREYRAGRSLAGLGVAEREALVAEIAETSDVQSEATRRVDDLARIARSALEGITGHNGGLEELTR